MSPREDLTARQRRAARYIALGLTQERTGYRVGVQARQIRRWLTDPDLGFRELVESIRLSEGEDLEPKQVLQDMLYSDDERLRLQAALALVRNPTPVPSDDDAEILAQGWDDE
jgi:hypothetical protein